MRFLVDECTGPAHLLENDTERLANSFVVVTETKVRFAGKS
jgi:hypothetical protein